MTIGRKIRTVSVVSLLLVGGLTGRLNAQDEPVVDCETPMTQMAMNICAGRAAKESDRKLNVAYQQLLKSYRGADLTEYRELRRESLITSQLAWIKYRDTSCKWQASKVSGGSMAPSVYACCLDRLTQQRTQELLADLEW